jgi:peptidoglycan/LPS O-acetylase OafA/YrhL
MKFKKLESVRGFAALYVCICHIWGNDATGLIRYCFSFAQEAVMVFFILSGFVVSWSVQSSRSPWSFKAYFLKRFMRIYSVWLLSMMFLWILEYFTPLRQTSIGLFELFGNLLMLQDFSSGKPAVLVEPLLGNTPLWSLHYEWWFYMLFPLVLLVPKFDLRVHVVGVVSAIAAILYVFYPNPICRLLFYFSIWWIGVYAAERLKAQGTLTLRDMICPLFYTALSSIPLLMLCWQYLESGKTLLLGVHPVLEARHLLMSVILVVAAFCWRGMSWIGFNYSIRSFSVVAPISYSLYITHYLSIHKAAYLNFFPSHIALPSYIILTVVFCYLTECRFYPWIRGVLLGRK